MRKKILLVEDDPSVLRFLTRRLIGCGHKILTATNGKVGLEKSLVENPDLIILDIKMPEMDGMAMLSQLRKSSDKKPHIIILTNLEPDKKILTDIMRDRPTNYFVKSDIKFCDLLSKINSLLA